MKARFFSILIILTIAFSCARKVIPKNHLAQENLNGKVKKVKSELYELVQVDDTFKIGVKINSRSLDRNEIQEFNNDGNLISNKEFLSNGKIDNESEYRYENGKLKKLVETDYYGRGSKSIYKYFYNEKDSIAKIIISNDSFVRTVIFERNKENRTIKQTYFQQDTIAGIFISKFDKHKNVIKESKYKNENTPIQIKEKSYNRNNLLITEKITDYKEWDTLIDIVNYKNYHNEYPIIPENYSENTIIENIYKKNSLVEYRIIPPPSDYRIITVQKFNFKENLTENIRIEKGDTTNIWKFNYIFDAKDNWIKKYSFKNNKPLTLVKREIDYY